ncbi:MAG: hypothetical protein QJR02_11490 [Sinobacteraceae bacterium]|nr:hypothetical protein [Nevskiaceae bacterium]
MKLDTPLKLNLVTLSICFCFYLLMSIPVLLGWTPAAEHCPQNTSVWMCITIQTWINGIIVVGVISVPLGIIGIGFLLWIARLWFLRRSWMKALRSGTPPHLESIDERSAGAQESTEGVDRDDGR